ncbi:MAG: hypothetical protein J0M02_15845 [Planctomycetes bacterium]|nr:hypothetical protein [Planctomycetota bacterium]
MRWLIGNWELKLVSLAVAVALWTYTSGQVRVEREILVELTPAQITGLPSDLQVAAVEPAEFVAVLSVPTSKLDALRDQVLRPQLSVPRDRRNPGDLEFVLTGRMLGFDADVRVLRTEPGDVRSVTVRLAAIAQAVLPAEPPVVVGLPAGIAAEVRLDRTQVEVKGPREIVEQARNSSSSIRFDPIRLDNVDPFLATPREERVALHVHEGQLVPVEPLVATVSLRPLRMATTTLRVAVPVLLAPGDAGRWRVEGDGPRAELRLTGPESVVRALKAEDVVAWLDLHAARLVAGEQELPVQVQPIDGVRIEPARVRLSLVPVP